MSHSRYTLYIVESPSIHDRRVDQQQGRRLQAELQSAGIASLYYDVWDRSTFYSALAKIAEQIGSRPDLIPIVHVWLHGCRQGIGFTQGPILAWGDLRKRLTVLNHMANGNLILALASCYGLFGLRTALEPGALPFHSVIGPWDKIDWEPSFKAFHLFYRLFIERGVDAALAAAYAQPVASCGKFLFVSTKDFLSDMRSLPLWKAGVVHESPRSGRWRR